MKNNSITFFRYSRISKEIYIVSLHTNNKINYWEKQIRFVRKCLCTLLKFTLSYANLNCSESSHCLKIILSRVSFYQSLVCFIGSGITEPVLIFCSIQSSAILKIQRKNIYLVFVMENSNSFVCYRIKADIVVKCVFLK